MTNLSPARAALGVFALALSPAATADAPAPPTTADPGPAAAPSTGADDTVEAAIDALRRGSIGDARRIVDALFVDERERTALALLGEGRAIESIAALDEALGVDGVDRDRYASLLVLRGRAAFAAANSDLRFASLYEEALQNFEEAARRGAGVGAALRASRAARMVGDGDRALQLARESVQWLDAAGDQAVDLDVDQSATRTWSEAAFGAYLAKKRSGDESEANVAACAALFDETQRAIERSIGEDPTDTWGYGQLANLFQWESRSEDALRALETALEVRPDDEPTHTAFVKLLGDVAESNSKAGGADDADALSARYDAILARYEAFRASHPENALGYWYGAFETFNLALDEFESAAEIDDFDPSGFRDAEALFRGCRERNADYADTCIDYEILCRTGAGWALYRGELDDDAVDAFFSTEELRPLDSEAVAERGWAGGLDLVLRGANGGARLPSALAGLDFVIRRCMADPTDLAGLTRAAELADRMFSARPDDPNLANNAGFVNRDAAVLWDIDASRRLRKASMDEANGASAEDLAAARAQAMESRARAQAQIERSWAAYQVAARLTPDDVRVVNDAGLVMAYYVRTDPEAAERYFLQAAKDGEEQLRTRELEDDEREALEEAWGDAHQNMGIIEMTIRKRPNLARDWFVKSLEIGPPSRNWLKTDVLPLLDSWIETGNRPSALDAVEARTVWVHNP
ncbi:MAG: hypothetical protein AAF957_04330 [Planctomycetota bacterium]